MKHPTYLQLMPCTMAGLSVAGALAIATSTGVAISNALAPSGPRGEHVTLAAALFYWWVLGGLALLLCAVLARSTWVFLTTYAVTPDAVCGTSAGGGGTVCLRFDEIVSVTSFRIIGPSPESDACRGHHIVGRDGSVITVSEAVPLWSVLLARRPDLSVPEMPKWGETCVGVGAGRYRS